MSTLPLESSLKLPTLLCISCQYLWSLLACLRPIASKVGPTIASLLSHSCLYHNLNASSFTHKYHVLLSILLSLAISVGLSVINWIAVSSHFSIWGVGRKTSCFVELVNCVSVIYLVSPFFTINNSSLSATITSPYDLTAVKSSSRLVIYTLEPLVNLNIGAFLSDLHFPLRAQSQTPPAQNFPFSHSQ